LTASSNAGSHLALPPCTRPYARRFVYSLTDTLGSGVRFREDLATDNPSISGWRRSNGYCCVTAVHLLEAGAEVNVIRAWLGHASLATTNRYAEITRRTKQAALEKCGAPEVGEAKIPRTPKGQSDTAYSIGCNRCERSLARSAARGFRGLPNDRPYNAGGHITWIIS
jgi:hypothetical protein